MIVIFLTGLVALIMSRALRQDIQRYNFLARQQKSRMDLAQDSSEVSSEAVAEEAGSFYVDLVRLSIIFCSTGVVLTCGLLVVTEETGWKLVHGDVFRPPFESPMLLCVLVGTGVQVSHYVALP